MAATTTTTTLECGAVGGPKPLAGGVERAEGNHELSAQRPRTSNTSQAN